MDHYIKEALKTSKTIIIPEIGALTKINETTGELMFLNYLKHDDGTLAQFISNKESISQQEAKNILAKHSREITAILNKGETYSIFKFGSFFKNDKGEFEFEQYKKSTKSTKNKIKTEIEEGIATENKIDKKKTKTKTKKDLEQDVTEIVVPILEEPNKSIAENIKGEVEEIKEKEIKTNEEINKASASASYIKENDHLEKTSESTESNKSISIIQESISSATESIINNESVSGTEKIKSNIEVTEKKDERLKEEKLKSESNKTSKPSSKKPLLIGILVLITSGVLGIILYVFVFNQEIQNQSNNTALTKPKEENQVLNSDTINAENDTSYNITGNETTDSTELDPIQPNVNELESKEGPTQLDLDVSKPYKLIAGTFQKSQFAESFSKKLKKGGVHCEVLNRNNQNFVVIEAFDDLKSANKALKKLKATIKNAWVLKLD